MKYTISILRRAQKEFAKLPAHIQSGVNDAILSLAQNPRPAGCKKLHGRAGWRIRVGEYRVIYDIDDQAATVSVNKIGSRGSVYHFIFPLF